MISRNRFLLKITKYLIKRRCTTAPPSLQTRKKITYTDAEKLAKLRDTFIAVEQENYLVPFFKKSLLHAEQIAIKDLNGEYTYFQLYMSAKKLSFQISNICGSGAMQNVAYLSANNAIAAVVQWACWMSGQIVLPLNVAQADPILKQMLADSEAKLILSTPEFTSLADKLSDSLDLSLVIVDHSFIPTHESVIPRMSKMLLVGPERVLIEGALVDDFYTNTNALLIYTLGTAGKPKGVMLSHKNLDAQMKSLVKAWDITETDTLLHVLPPDNGLSCTSALMSPLSVGGRIVMQDTFNGSNVWSTLLSVNLPAKDRVNMFISAPAVYATLISDYDKIFLDNSRMVEYIENYCKKHIRLMASGFAPLPEDVFNRWRQITGHNLVHSYGLTETGIVLSNALSDENEKAPQRNPNTVGLPLPGVKVRLVDERNVVLVTSEGSADVGFWANEPINENEHNSNQIIGELQISGANVFKKYFYKPGPTPDEEKLGLKIIETWRMKEEVTIDESIILARYELEQLRKKKEAAKLAKMQGKLEENGVKETQVKDVESKAKQLVSPKEITEKHKYEIVQGKELPKIMQMEMDTQPLKGLSIETVAKMVEKPKNVLDPTPEAIGIQLIDGLNIVEESKLTEDTKTTENDAEVAVVKSEEKKVDDEKFSGEFFRTGDLAIYENGVYSIWGRASDINQKTVKDDVKKNFDNKEDEKKV